MAKVYPQEVQFRVIIMSTLEGDGEGGLGRVETRVMTLIGILLEAVLGKGHTKVSKERRTETQIQVERIIGL